MKYFTGGYFKPVEPLDTTIKIPNKNLKTNINLKTKIQ
jgi:hypothetical protein